MRTYKQQLKTVLACSLFAALSINSPVFAESAEKAHDAHEGHHAPNTPDWLGTYQGFLPCADCAGMKTTLALNKNNTYLMIYQYSGKSEREYVEKGTFAWTDKDRVLQLTPRKAASNTGPGQFYYVGDNSLIQLDNSGNRITGKLAEKYVLHRYDVTQSTPSSGGSHGAH